MINRHLFCSLPILLGAVLQLISLQLWRKSKLNTMSSQCDQQQHPTHSNTIYSLRLFYAQLLLADGLLTKACELICLMRRLELRIVVGCSWMGMHSLISFLVKHDIHSCSYATSVTVWMLKFGKYATIGTSNINRKHKINANPTIETQPVVHRVHRAETDEHEQLLPVDANGDGKMQHFYVGKTTRMVSFILFSGRFWLISMFVNYFRPSNMSAVI